MKRRSFLKSIGAISLFGWHLFSGLACASSGLRFSPTRSLSQKDRRCTGARDQICGNGMGSALPFSVLNRLRV